MRDPSRFHGIDHLVEGTKEWHAARRIDHPEVLVCGHAFVDVWAAVHPRVVGRSRWDRDVYEIGDPAGSCKAGCRYVARRPSSPSWARAPESADFSPRCRSQADLTR